MPFSARFAHQFSNSFVTSPFSTCTGISLPMQNDTLSEKLYDFVPVLHATPPFTQHIAAAKADRLKRPA